MQKFMTGFLNKNKGTERGGSVVTQGGPGFNLVEVFSGFLNLKITKEFVIFKDKCRVGLHIPLEMSKFNVSQDDNF